jgi:hypothetical protein
VIALPDYVAYRTGAKVGLRCPCGWRQVLSSSVLLSEIIAAADRHSAAEHPLEQIKAAGHQLAMIRQAAAASGIELRS